MEVGVLFAEESEIATEEEFAEAEWPLDDEEGLDEQMLAVLAALEQYPSELVENGLAEAHALRNTPPDEQHAIRVYARSPGVMAPVVSLAQTASKRRAPRELRAA